MNPDPNPNPNRNNLNNSLDAIVLLDTTFGSGNCSSSGKNNFNSSSFRAKLKAAKLNSSQ